MRSAIAGAPIVVLAERYRTRTIASLDHRHFDVLRSLDGGSFEVVEPGPLKNSREPGSFPYTSLFVILVKAH